MSGRTADEEILVGAEAERIAVVHPELLDRLELAPDAGVEADEREPSLNAVVFEGALGQRRAVGAPAADDAVPVRQPAAEESRASRGWQRRMWEPTGHFKP